MSAQQHLMRPWQRSSRRYGRCACGSLGVRFKWHADPHTAGGHDAFTPSSHPMEADGLLLQHCSLYQVHGERFKMHLKK